MIIREKDKLTSPALQGDLRFPSAKRSHCVGARKGPSTTQVLDFMSMTFVQVLCHSVVSIRHLLRNQT